MSALGIIAASGVANTALSGLKGAFSREIDEGINATKVELMGTSYRNDLPNLINIAVHGMPNVRELNNLFKLQGYITEIYTSDFFQHSIKAKGQVDTISGQQIIGNQTTQQSHNRDTDAMVWGAQVGFDPTEIVVLLNRGEITEQVASWHLRRSGVRDWDVQRAKLSLRHQVPPAGDLIRFAVRDAFTPAIVDKYGYAEEYPTAIDKYLAWQGLGWPTGYQSPGGTDERGKPRLAHDATWGEISWFAHWELPSPTQAYDMFHMLYPDSRFGPSPYVKDALGQVKKDVAFTAEDLSLLLKTADYPIYWRKRLEAISNPPLTRVDTRRMYQLGIIDEPTVYHQYRAQGYDDANAWALTQYTKVDVRPDVSKYVCSLYKDGILDKLESVALLQKGKMSKLQAEAFIGKCDLEMTTELIRQTVKSTRDAVIHGVITLDEGEAILFQLGMVNPRVGQYRDQWSLELRFHERIPTLRVISAWYVDGIIDRNDFIGRLQRLQYSDSSISRLVKAADGKKQKATAKEEKDTATQQAKANQAAERAAAGVVKRLESAQAKAEKQAAKQAKAIEQASKAIQKQLDESAKAKAKALKEEQDAFEELRQGYAAAGTDKNLIAFWRSGVIDVSGIRDRLSARGFLVSDQDRWIATYLREEDNAEG